MQYVLLICAVLKGHYTMSFSLGRESVRALAALLPAGRSINNLQSEARVCTVLMRSGNQLASYIKSAGDSVTAVQLVANEKS